MNNQTGPEDPSHSTLGDALERFYDSDDTTLVAQAAHELFLLGGDDLATFARDRPTVPVAFLERLIFAEATYEREPDVAKAMLTSIVRDPAFEAQPQVFQAQMWEALAGVWRKEYERTGEMPALDNTILAFRKTVDAGEAGASMRLTIYLHGLGTSLIERASKAPEGNDYSIARSVFQQGLGLCKDDTNMKSLFLNALSELGDKLSADDDFSEILDCLGDAARDMSWDGATQNNIRLRLGKLARERVLSQRSIELADRAEKILVVAFTGLPKLDQYAQVLMDDAAKIRGWRESLRSLPENDRTNSGGET